MEIDQVDPNPNAWFFDYAFMDDISAVDFSAPPQPAIGFTWMQSTALTPCQSLPAVSSEIESSFIEFEAHKGTGSRKRFIELGSIVEPGRPLKTDKTAILSDAIRMIKQLQDEAEKLNQSNADLHEKIKELKAEKNELRDEKQKLKLEKDKLEQQVKSINGGQPGYLAHPAAMRAAFAAQDQAVGNKLMPFVSYPSVAMWQFMPSSVVDTTQDHVLRPPVA
ncbi:hypothetical protein M8C21_025946 [Ambrosia artemisiifolia]|uniref:Transcription factor ILR3-like protein n=1 Tax=Ambrosia artemisiifolia TaxID=4212 RepID=A0AAD5GRP7_AMBAR|nr:hypothetical protein M8C21_025946 [Ambrosia artemisiifolia]